MGLHRRIALLVSLLSPLASCKRTTPPPPLTQPSPSVAPDRLAAGELPPGIEKAHDLVLPRGSRVERRFGTSVYAIVPMSIEEMANHVRKQADDPQSTIGPHGTVFAKLKVKNAGPDHFLRIEISSTGFQHETSVFVDRIEEKPPPPKESNEEAMKKAGLTPDGKLLDPSKLD